MKKEFPGFYSPTKEEFKIIWDTCDFFFDTNILLNLYRYSEDTRETLIKILEGINDRIWITYQVGFEYHTRRVKVLKDLADAYEKIEKTLSKHLNQITEELVKQCKSGRHPYINCEGFIDEFSKFIGEYSNILKEKSREHPDLMIEDPIKDKLAKLFKGKVSTQLETEEIEKVIKDGAKRYEKKIPPGYGDIKKSIPDRYGDLIIWFEIIEHAKKRRKPIIFVTDDGKEDWWNHPYDKTIGPRPELVNEISIKANVNFYMYSADKFMKYAEEFLNSEVEETAINEAREIRLQEEKAQTQLEKISDRINAFSAIDEANYKANIASIYTTMKKAGESSNISSLYSAIKAMEERTNNSSVFNAMSEALRNTVNQNELAAMNETAKYARSSLISAALNEFDSRVRDAIFLTSRGTIAETLNEISESNTNYENDSGDSQDREINNKKPNVDEDNSD